MNCEKDKIICGDLFVDNINSVLESSNVATDKKTYVVAPARPPERNDDAKRWALPLSSRKAGYLCDSWVMADAAANLYCSMNMKLSADVPA